MATNSALPSPFEAIRRRIGQQQMQAGQQSREAVQRFAARAGGLTSGSTLKMQEEAAAAAATPYQEQIAQLELAEAQQIRGEQEAERQRAFARQLQQEQQAFAKTEGEAGRAFAGREAEAQRGIQREFFKTQQDFQERQFDFNKRLQERGQDFQAKGLDLETQAQAFNKLISAFSVPDHVRMVSVLTQLGDDPSMPQNFRANISGYLSAIQTPSSTPQARAVLNQRQGERDALRQAFEQSQRSGNPMSRSQYEQQLRRLG